MYAVDLGGLHTSWAVPPLLGAFYAVLGSLFILSDQWLGSKASNTLSETPALFSQNVVVGAALGRPQRLGLALAAAGILALDLELSAYLYKVGSSSRDVPLMLLC